MVSKLDKEEPGKILEDTKELVNPVRELHPLMVCADKPPSVWESVAFSNGVKFIMEEIEK